MMNKKENQRNRKNQIFDVPSFSGLTYDCQQYRNRSAYHKEDCGGSQEAVDPQTEQPAPEVQDPQVAPQPEQDTKTVTYKGKVVDKDGKPIQGVEILSVPNSTPTEVTTQADGSFEFKASPKAKLLFLYQDGNKKKGISSLMKDTQRKQNEWTIVYNEKWNEVMQSDPGTPDNPIFEVVEHMPEFTGGGMPALMENI